MHRKKIVLLGMMSRMPVAGVIWQTMHYLEGFRRLGYDVYYVEAHGRNPMMLMKSDEDDITAISTRFIAEVCQRFGFGDCWAFQAMHGKTMNSYVDLKMLREADREVRKLGPRPAMVKLDKSEPQLVNHIVKGMDRVWRKLRTFGVIDGKDIRPIDATLYPEILRVVISAVEAQRKAQFAILAQLRQRRTSGSAVATADAPLVTADMLDEAEMTFWPLGRDRTMRELHAIEPELQRFIVRVHASVQEQIAGYEMPESVREMLSEQLMVMGAICVSAARKAT